MIHGAALLTIILSVEAGATSRPVVRPPVDLIWEAPPGCPATDTIQAGIARGLPGARQTVAPMRARVVVTRVAARQWRATLDLSGAHWKAARTLEGQSCAAVSDAAGLEIVLALNAEQKRQVLVSPPPPPPPPPPPVTLPGSTPFLGLGGALEVGALPGPTAGGALSVGWRFQHVSLELAGSLYASRRGTVAGPPVAVADFSLMSADLRGCYLFGAGLTLGPCVAAGINRTRNFSMGALGGVDDKTYRDTILAGGVRGEWRLWRWVGPFLIAEAAFPLGTRQLLLRGAPVYRTSVVSLRCIAGLELRFR